MAIYTRYGVQVKVLANCGECQVKHLQGTQTLIKIQYMDDDSESYYFVDFLIADEGWRELWQFVNNAPDITLSSEEFEKAIKEAM